MNITYGLSIIAAKKYRAEEKVRLVLQKLYADPTFLAIANRKGELEFEIAKREAYDIDLGTLKEDLATTEKAFSEALRSHGYTENDLNPTYECSRCGDTGFVDGKRCACLNNAIFASLRDACGSLETELSDFSEIDYSVYGELAPAYRALCAELNKYCTSFPNTKRLLVFSGGTGVGKSFLASVIANAVMKRDFSVFFLHAAELNKRFLRYHTAPVDQKDGIFAPLFECDLLVIDDLGCEPSLKNVTANYLTFLLSGRKDKNTIITTNLSSRQDFEGHYEQRVYSRLADKNNSSIINISGKDLRFR